MPGPEIGTVRTYQGETRKWTGTEWILVDKPPEGPPPATAAPLKEEGTFEGLARGVEKGAARVIGDLGKTVSSIPGVSQAVDWLYGTPGISKQAFKTFGEENDPKGTAENVGAFGVDAATFAAAPQDSLLSAVLGNAGLSAARTQGDPTATVLSGLAGGAGYGVSKGLSGWANAIREGEAAKVTDPAVRRIFSATDQSSIPAGVLQDQRETFAALIKKYGLTGAASDAEIIARAPQGLRDDLNELSNQLSKPRPFSHIWSTLAAASELPAAMTGHGLEGLGISGPLLAMGLAGKYPGYAAKYLTKGAPIAGRMLSAGGGAGVTDLNRDKLTLDDPIVKALLGGDNAK